MYIEKTSVISKSLTIPRDYYFNAEVNVELFVVQYLSVWSYGTERNCWVLVGICSERLRVSRSPLSAPEDDLGN